MSINSFLCSLFVWRILAACSPSFLHAVINIRLSLPVSFHTTIVSSVIDFQPIAICQTPGRRSHEVNRLFIFPSPSFFYCTLNSPEHVSLWQPPVVHAEERPHPQNIGSRHINKLRCVEFSNLLPISNEGRKTTTIISQSCQLFFFGGGSGS